MTMQRQVEANTALEQLHAAIEVGRHEIEDKVGAPLCIDKCGMCCMNNTPMITELEADYIISVYGVRKEFKEMVSRNLNWMSTDFRGANSRHVKKQDVLAHEAEIVAHKQCPFLQEDMSCGIYEARPLVCRGYGVSIMADDYCPRPIGFHEDRSHKMMIFPTSKLGQFMSQAKKLIFDEAKKLDKARVAFMPYWICMAMARRPFEALVNENKVADVKLMVSDGIQPNLFMGQDQALDIIEQEKNYERQSGSSIQLRGQYDWSPKYTG